MSLSELLRGINIKVHEKKYSEALDICKTEVDNKEVQTSFVFWHAAGQCSSHCSEWKLAEKYLTKAISCSAPAPQQQKNLKVLLLLTLFACPIIPDLICTVLYVVLYHA